MGTKDTIVHIFIILGLFTALLGIIFLAMRFLIGSTMSETYNSIIIESNIAENYKSQSYEDIYSIPVFSMEKDGSIITVYSTDERCYVELIETKGYTLYDSNSFVLDNETVIYIKETGTGFYVKTSNRAVVFESDGGSPQAGSYVSIMPSFETPEFIEYGHGDETSLIKTYMDIYVPSGKIAYCDVSGLYIAGLDGNNKRLLASNTKEIIFANPRFMVGGGKILCETYSAGLEPNLEKLMAVDVETGVIEYFDGIFSETEANYDILSNNTVIASVSSEGYEGYNRKITQIDIKNMVFVRSAGLPEGYEGIVMNGRFAVGLELNTSNLLIVSLYDIINAETVHVFAKIKPDINNNETGSRIFARAVGQAATGFVLLSDDASGLKFYFIPVG